MSQHTDTNSKTKARPVSQDTDPCSKTKARPVSQDTDPCSKTKARPVSQDTDPCSKTKARPASQDTDPCSKTKAWAVSQHADTGTAHVMGYKCCLHTQFSHPWNAFVSVQLRTPQDPPECSAGKHYNHFCCSLTAVVGTVEEGVRLPECLTAQETSTSFSCWANF